MNRRKYGIRCMIDMFAAFNIGTANPVNIFSAIQMYNEGRSSGNTCFLHIKSEFGMRFAALILFAVFESQWFMSGTVFPWFPI